ncbi:hypothetical protein MKZ38_010636 [Zalerion maritima]|uniref:PARP catalytic domain-containing protein n=1 Tax=Zalerion maritima TaxID=339359 RepID=A0AAD5RFV8_9PEZI|nr:hypothetical protein MKZ38_010636 [Zalerion maritima]
MMIFKDPASRPRKEKKPSLGQRLLRGSSAANTLSPDHTVPRTSTQATKLPPFIPPETSLRFTATSTTAGIPLGTTPSSATLSPPSRDCSLSIHPDAASIHTHIGSDEISQDSSSIQGGHRKLSGRFKIGSRSNAPSHSRKESIATAADTDDHVTPSYTLQPPAPSGHVAWQVEQFLSSFGVDLGVQSESAALISALDWAKTELKKREGEAQRWKARSEDLLQKTTGGEAGPDQDASSSSTPMPGSYVTGAPSDASAQLQKAWSRNDWLDSEINTLRDLLRRGEKDHEAAQVEIGSLKKELGLMGNLQEENTELRKRYAEANNGWNENYSKMVTTLNELHKMKDDFASAKAANAASVEKIFRLTTELDTASKTRMDAETKFKNLQQSVKAMESNHAAALTKAKADKKSQVPKLQTRVAELSAELCAGRAKYEGDISQLQEHRDKLVEIKAVLEDRWEKAKVDLDVKSSLLQLKSSVADSMSARLESLSGSLDVEIARSQALQNEKCEAEEDARKTIKDLKTKASRLEMEILDLKPKLDGSRGKIVGVIDDASYSDLVAKWNHLSAIRGALESHDQEATALLLEKYNIEAGGFWCDDIPDDLVDVIDRYGPFKYELAFPLTHLRDIDRAARGVPREARMLLVRVDFSTSTPSFCVHLDHNGDTGGTHELLAVASTTKCGLEYNMCAKKPCRLVYQLYRYLYLFLAEEGACSLNQLYQTIRNTVSSRASSCLVCAKPTGTSLWRAAPCSADCSKTLNLAPLSVQFPELTIDPPVLDLILHCLYIAAAHSTKLDLTPRCPVEKDNLQGVIDSFPPIDSKTFVQDVYSNAANPQQPADRKSADRWRLLRWICTEFQGLLMSAPEKMKVPSMPGSHQFVLANGNLDKEREFADALSRATVTRGSSNGNGNGSLAAQGGVAFHGTTPQRIFRILTEGLKVMSGTPFMTYGQASGPGVYFAAEPSKSMPYATPSKGTWRHGRLGNRTRILLGCEVAGWTHSAGTVHVAKNATAVMVRYIFVVPGDFRAPISGHVEPAMRSTFASIKR